MTADVRNVAFGATGIEVSALGLGCSHIASLSTRANRFEIDKLLDQAWEGGVRVFDTADIYGQGDSERRLARIALRPGAVIITKAGLRLKGSQSLIRLAKPLVRPLLATVNGLRRAAAHARQVSEDHDLDPARLTARLEGSLKRLGRDQVELFLLHSPPRSALLDHKLFELLQEFKSRGLARAVGVSCQVAEDAQWILDQGGVDALQVPMCGDDLERLSPMLGQAQAQGVGVIAREVLAGRDPLQALPPLLRDPRVGVTLVGTTNPKHLLRNMAVAEIS